jgi:hypothetical protein
MMFFRRVDRCREDGIPPPMRKNDSREVLGSLKGIEAGSRLDYREK